MKGIEYIGLCLVAAFVLFAFPSVFLFLWDLLFPLVSPILTYLLGFIVDTESPLAGYFLLLLCWALFLGLCFLPIAVVFIAIRKVYDIWNKRNR